MKNKFCKVFETERGQILVVRDIDDNGAPCINIYAQPDSNDIELANLVIRFNDTDKGAGGQLRAFEKIDEEIAIKAAAHIFDLQD